MAAQARWRGGLPVCLALIQQPPGAAPACPRSRSLSFRPTMVSNLSRVRAGGGQRRAVCAQAGSAAAQVRNAEWQPQMLCSAVSPGNTPADVGRVAHVVNLQVSSLAIAVAGGCARYGAVAPAGAGAASTHRRPDCVARLSGGPQACQTQPRGAISQRARFCDRPHTERCLLVAEGVLCASPRMHRGREFFSRL